ncbi:MAG: zinc ribbon domain-containing protein [Nitrospinae bacterium]|nr:zinc ribbon domain-containing protein [Nitrospinota bacterium]
MMVVVEVLLVLAIMAAIGYPLFVQPKLAEGADEGDAHHKLVAQKESAFVALKDLDFDFRTGKIDEEDYARLKAQYEAEAVTVMKKLDGNTAEPQAKPAKQKVRYCATCGAQTEADDRFCSACGKPLKK